MPAPAAAATTAMSTMKAAMRFHIDVGGGGGAGIHAGGGVKPSAADGGSKVWSGGVSDGCPGSVGLCSDIDLSSGNSLELRSALQIAPASCEAPRRFLGVS